MALKQDLNEIKKEIGAEEQFLESVIKGERFFNKYKKVFILAFIIAIIAIIGFYANKLVNQNRVEKANEAYSKLITNPNDTAALQILKEKAPSLYALYELKARLANGDTNGTKELLDLFIDPIIKQIIVAQDGENSEILSSYGAFIKGYELLKQDKIDEAKAEFAKIPLDSQLTNLVKNLQHYQGIK
ncbi:hypothetical protein KDE13_04140 [Campylobacter sp. faydin G-140]|uniref:hypothetical protein n=1 Tax=Campylobacter anatolicus TaxID=2829105 RepID=UPI001B975040|nr:hypothetical protein [Campylobacter anatolicus]MBR8465550.1 hypothetical protein [Campylobacter anatolicus]